MNKFFLLAVLSVLSFVQPVPAINCDGTVQCTNVGEIFKGHQIRYSLRYHLETTNATVVSATGFVYSAAGCLSNHLGTPPTGCRVVGNTVTAYSRTDASNDLRGGLISVDASCRTDSPSDGAALYFDSRYVDAEGHSLVGAQDAYFRMVSAVAGGDLLYMAVCNPPFATVREFRKVQALYLAIGGVAGGQAATFQPTNPNLPMILTPSLRIEVDLLPMYRETAYQPYLYECTHLLINPCDCFYDAGIPPIPDTDCDGLARASTLTPSPASQQGKVGTFVANVSASDGVASTSAGTFIGVLAAKTDGTIVRLGVMANAAFTPASGTISVSDYDLGLTAAPAGSTSMSVDVTTDVFVVGELDINKDGRVDWADRKIITSLYGTTVAQPTYLGRADVTLDGVINASDLQLYAVGWQAVACQADFNANGLVSTQDLFDFMAVWFVHDPVADFNANGTVTVQDLLEFLAAWFARC